MSRPQELFPYFADIEKLDGVGPKTKILLGKAMGTRVKDLIFTPPTGLIDRRYRPKIENAVAGEITTLDITVGKHSPATSRARPYKVTIYDETDEMDVIFFKAHPKTIEKNLPEGERRIISGKTEAFNTRLQMTHPDYILSPEQLDTLPEIEPLYPLTAGLGQKAARKAVHNALKDLLTLPEWIDPALLARQHWPAFNEALLRLHLPEHAESAKPDAPIRQRLAYDELFAKQLAMALVRERTRKESGRRYTATGEYVADVLKAAPFPPTGAQDRVSAEIRTDLESEFRMARLLQGDVGAGKTFVAALAAAHVAESGAQVAIMAPTEILARQHLKSFREFLEPAGLTVEALTGRDKGPAREALATGLRDGYIDVVIGTHALFQDKVEFHDLGLAIIDEQHRFGVHDRLKLTQKGRQPDLLVMTATPIPRTLALASYGDLDTSILDEKPAGRQEIQTSILPIARLDDVIEGIGRTVTKGEQAYWVCPLVEDSEVMDLASAEARHKELQAIYGNRVGLLHGRLDAKEKQAINESFRRGDIDILVATTVIEVGVDSPNATVIIIEHAERFGLAQLHQLRGRVGRSDLKSSCVLLYQGPLGVTGKARLETMRSTNDGFRIAEKDWELRGEGDVLGAAQSGLPRYRLADLDRHKALLEVAQQDARLLAATDPGLTSPRGHAARLLLYLFEQEVGVALMKAG
jgi:ATP-dependent DNA helicase RecG